MLWQAIPMMMALVLCTFFPSAGGKGYSRLKCQAAGAVARIGKPLHGGNV
ncbi:MAG: hypothetical protein RML35_15185 [Chloroherpetonaceae bacterium]|nr:hypothetical protein [Chloroherpetonaceae bacterium]